MNTDDQQYTITLTGKQARMIANACDLVARLGLGQWREALPYLPLKDRIGTYAAEKSVWPSLRPFLDEDLQVPNTNYGVGSDKSVPLSDDYRMIDRIIAHRLAWDKKPEGDIFLDFYPPTRFGKETQPDIRIAKV